MTEAHPYNRLYELKGRSLAAAKELQAEIHAAVQRERPKNSGNLGEIHQSWQQFYDRQLKRLQHENPALLQATGLLHAAVQVKEDPGFYPRAYQEFPAIFLSPQTKPRYFMYAPVDIDGNNFVPEDGALLMDAERHKVDALLFAGGWLGNAPLFDRAALGVDLPQNYRSSQIKNDFFSVASGRAELAFIAGGQSLAAVRDYQTRLTDHEQRMTAAMKALEAAIEKTYPQVPPQNGKADFSLSISGNNHINRGADTCFSFSVRQSMDGQPVQIPDSPAFTVVPDGDPWKYEYNVVTRDDTPEGRALKKILLAVPLPRPDLADYPSLKIAATAPVLSTHGQYQVLRYFIKSDKVPNKTPPDARPFSVAALRWLMNDDSDRRRGVTPPPMPQALKDRLTAPLSADSSAKKSAEPGKHP